MNLAFLLKATETGQKVAKTNVVPKNANRCHTEAKG